MKINIRTMLISLILSLTVNYVFADSLWVSSEEGEPQSIYSDHRARKVGDIITILIVETATVSQRVGSSRARRSGIRGEVKEWRIPEAAEPVRLPIWEIDTDNRFTGGGTHSGNYNFRGQITARVIEVLPNKNMVVEGTSEVLINRERNIISISGIVRPEDITVANTVLSTQLADAKIRIIGKGPLHDKTGRGFLETLLDWLWPF